MQFSKYFVAVATELIIYLNDNWDHILSVGLWFEEVASLRLTAGGVTMLGPLSAA